MEKKLLVKVQKVGSIKEDKTLKYSSALTIEPEDEITTRRGSLYAVVDVSSDALFDPTLVKKVISDTFQSEYFANAEGTPLQCIEKAASEVRDRVLSLLQDANVPASVGEFHIVISILWGSVLYVVQYGYGCSYLIRDGRIRPINTLSEGDFSVASGVVKDSDIVILGSRAFCESYTPDALIKSPSEFLAREGVSAVVLKFSIDKDDSSYSTLDFNDSSTPKNIKISRNYNPKKKKAFFVALSFVVGILLFGSVFSSFKKTNIFNAVNESEVVLAKGRENLNQAVSLMSTDSNKAKELLLANKNLLEEAKTKISEDKSSQIADLIKENLTNLDLLYKITRVNPDVVYDVRVDDKDADPSELAIVNSETLLIADSKRSKLYELKIFPSIAFAAVESTQAANPKFLSTSGLGVYLMGNDSFYFYDSGNKKLSKSESKFEFPLTGVSAATAYIGNFYAVKDGTVLKNNVLWTSDVDTLKEVTSMAIDGSIYILTKAGSIAKYSAGTKDNFSLKGFEGTLSSPLALYTNIDLENFHVLESSGRIVVFDKEGNYIKQIILEGDTNVQNIKTFAVSKDESVAYLLAGSKIYKVKLKP